MKKISEYYPKLRSYEIIFASLIVMLVVIVLSLKFLLPNFNIAREIFKEQDKLRDRITALGKKSRILSSVDPAYYKDNLNKLSQILPINKDFVSLFSTLDSLQTKTGIIVIGTQFEAGSISTPSGLKAAAKPGQAIPIPIKLEVLGEKSQYEKFLTSLYDLSGRLITIEDGEFTLRNDGLIQAKISGLAFFYPIPSTAERIDTPLQELTKTEIEILNKVASRQPIYGTSQEVQEIDIGKEDLFN